MCKWWDKMTGNHKSSAKVVDGSLVLSLPDATTPVIWRMELGNAKASALEVRKTESQGEECFTLVLKTPQGDTNDIASYEHKPKAVRALVEVSEALEKSAQAQPKPRAQLANTSRDTSNSSAAHAAANTNAEPSTQGQKTGSGKWFILILGLLLVSGLGFYLNGLSTSGYDSYTSAGNAASSLNPASGTKTQTGVPLSADDFLRE